MTDLESRIAALSPQQREVLERRLAERAAPSGPGQERIAPRDRSRPTPLAIQQQREWAFGHFRGANNIIGAFRVEGEVDRELLGRALTDVTERHEVLRSTVEQQPDGTRVQVVSPVSPVPVPVEDLTHLTEEEQRAEIRRRWVREVGTPFAPSALRLRISLLHLGPARHVVLITTDHAAGDLVSMNFLVQEFAALYVLRREGGGTLPPPEVQYGDFAVWQRAVEERRIDAEREHWRETLDGVAPGLALPTDRPYPVAPAFTAGVHRSALPADLTAGLRRLADAERASIGVVLSAAAAVLLHRYTGRPDIVVGEILFGRNRAEIEGTIGCFVGALPLRLRVSGELTLREVVQRARVTTVTAYGHQDLPVDAMLDQLGLGPEVSVGSLIDLWLDVRTPPTPLEVPGLAIVPEEMPVSLAPSPLQLGVDPDAATLSLEWLYMAELFDHGTVVVLAEQFERILRGIVDAPDTAVDHVALAVEPASTAPAGPRATATFVELFQRRVAQAPHAAAAVHAGAVTTYGELNRAANRLARRLRAAGVGPETPVGILVDRTPELATAILGVLKAGGLYVPLDTGHPPARGADVLTDAGVRVLVTQERHASVFADAGLAGPDETVLLDGPTADGADVADTDLPDLPDPASLAYVVHTSGSTGRPKGAMIEHGSLVTYALDVRDRLGLGSGDRFLQFASPAFDVLAEELFPVWLAGGAVVFPDRPLVTGGGDLTELVERERITVAELPTAFWHEWVRELDRRDQGPADSLRLVVIGGERALPERIALWRERTDTPLVNCYGLTETTVTSAFFRLDPADPVTDWPNLPIGTPVPSAELRVLDEQLRPVPAGAAGEVYIGGVSLARGYLGQPGLTAARFVADPAGDGGRLYRTGDLVRRRADGNLEFLARVDTQIKIRGYRIEPTGIESAIDRFPQVAASVVAAWEPAPGDRRLAAWVVARSGESLSVAELRRFLDGELPAHLVPTAFVELDALPLSTTGKIDRGALPAPDGSRPEQDEEYVAPRNPAERMLADAVAEILRVQRVGVHDNFFEIGGDSILAIQLVAHAQERGLTLSPFDVFAHPTVAGLADIAAAGPVVDAEQGDVSGPVPLAPSQRWLCTAGVADPHHANRSTVLDASVLARPGAVDPDHVREAVERLLTHHDGLRQRILVAGPSTRVRIAPRGDVVPFEVHDLGGSDGTGPTAEEVTAALQTGLDPAIGPLLRVALLRSAGEPDRLAVVVHRLVADEGSLGIVVEDLVALLDGLRAGGPAPLPTKTTSWQSWVRRLVRHGRGDAVQAERAHWTDLATAPAGRTPADDEVPAGEDAVAGAATVTSSLDAAATAELLRLPDALGCGLPAVLLAALGRTLASWTGHDRHVVDLVRHDRVRLFDEVDLSRTVGPFGHVHPVALDVAADGPADAAVRAVAAHLRGVPGDGVGWGLLRQDADPVPDAPVDVAFAHVDGPPRPALDGDESPRNRRRRALEVEVRVVDDELVVRWTHGARHHEATVARAAERYAAELRALADLGSGPAGAPAASDFPLAHVDQDQLDALLSRL